MPTYREYFPMQSRQNQKEAVVDCVACDTRVHTHLLTSNDNGGGRKPIQTNTRVEPQSN